MQVLFVYDSLSDIGGGSQVTTLNLFLNYKKNGITVKLLTTKKIFEIEPTISYKDVILVKEWDLRAIYPCSIGWPFFNQEIKKQLADFNPQVIHLNEPSFVTARMSIFAKASKIPVIDHFHTNHSEIKIATFPLSLFFNGNGIGNYLQSLLKKYNMKNSSVVIAPTKSIANTLRKNVATRVEIIPYSIPDNFFTIKKRIKRKPTKLVFMSRFDNHKKIKELIQVMKLVETSFTLDIYGDGPQKKELEDKIINLQLQKCVKLKYWVAQRDLPEVLGNYDIFISLSDFETFGLTYIESLATGLPCIVYDYKTTREILPKSMVVFVKDFKPQSWARALLELQNSAEKYKKLVENIGAEYSKLYVFKAKSVVSSIIEIDKSLVTQKK
ncbi:MAG: glycosyltransferase family 4 protein [Microgenomates group bacterium]